MKSLYVTSSAFITLHSPETDEYARAVQFLQSLFSTNVQTYTSTFDVMMTAHTLFTQHGSKKMNQFLELLKDGGISEIPYRDGLVEEAYSLIHQGELTVSLYHAMVVQLMHEADIKNVFTFDERFAEFNVLISPK